MTKQTKLTIGFFCIVKLTLHIMADSHSGFQSDEFLYIESGRHLAFGYMECPPLTGLLAFIQNGLHSHSVFVYHIFPHMAMLLIVIYVGKITVELGGKTIAVLIALFCLLIAPGFEGSQQPFEPVVFSQLFWVICFYQLVRFIKYEDKKYVWYLTLCTALFFLTKYDALFFCFGLLSLLFFRRTRVALIKAKFWQCLIIALLIVLPNIIWQYVNDWPVLQMFHRLYETQLDGVTPLHTLRDVFLSVNPFAFIMILSALIFMFVGKSDKPLYLPLACSILLSVLFLACSKGKAYYFFPIVLTILPCCGIFREDLLLSKRKWLFYPLSFILLLGALLIPFGMPVLSFPHYLNSVFKISPKEIKNGKPVLPMQEYDANQRWKMVMEQLQLVYDSLPEKEKKDCLIWGKHYSQAGAVELFKDEFRLPNAFSYHGSFYTWAPAGKMPGTVIAFCYNDAGDDFFNPFFEQVTPVRKIFSDYASSEGWVVQTIYICHKPKQSFDKMKELFSKRIFE
jgi:4-amino-4-deoxy-L-arabinose transferase-like glycosyltransferase